MKAEGEEKTVLKQVNGIGKRAHLNRILALAGVAQWIECQPANQKVEGSIPSQGTCLSCRPGP